MSRGMKRLLREHGDVLHGAGFRGCFPVRGATRDDIGFATPGRLEGRTPVGWHEFFPVFDRRRLAVLADDADGTFQLLPRDEARRRSSDA